MNGFLRLVFLGYFITHIPITLSLDLQALFGPYYPPAFQALSAWYVSTYNDQLMMHPPAWFKSFIVAELLFQLPFFFVATYGLLFKKNWIRIPSIIYGTHVATTLLPILADTLTSAVTTQQQKLVLFGFYFPYFLIPALLAGYMAVYPLPFEKSSAKKQQ